MSETAWEEVKRQGILQRCTDRTRKVLQLAARTADEWEHKHVGTEHLLVGLVEEGTGVAAGVLKNLGVSLEEIRRETETLLGIKPKDHVVRHCIGCGTEVAEPSLAIVCSECEKDGKVRVVLNQIVQSMRSQDAKGGEAERPSDAREDHSGPEYKPIECDDF